MQAPIGKNVQYFRTGSKDERPTAAVVVEYNGQRMVHLNLLLPGGGESRFIRNIYHVSDPELQINPELARKNGCWDWIPGEEPSANEKPAPKYRPSVTRLPAPGPDHSQIIEMSRQGKSPGVIAKELGGSHTPLSVGRVLKRAKSEAVAV